MTGLWPSKTRRNFGSEAFLDLRKSRRFVALPPMPNLQHMSYRVDDYGLDQTEPLRSLLTSPRLLDLCVNTFFTATIRAFAASGLHGLSMLRCQLDYFLEEEAAKLPYQELLACTIQSKWPESVPVQLLSVTVTVSSVLSPVAMALILRQRGPWCEIELRLDRDTFPKESLAQTKLWIGSANAFLDKSHFLTRQTLIDAGFGGHLTGLD